MRILINTMGYSPHLGDNIKADYLANWILHGFRELFGADAVDFPKQDFMYPNFPNPMGLWGRGFGYSSSLSDIPINRDPDFINRQILDNQYEAIIFCLHHSIHNNPGQLYHMLGWLVQNGVKSKIITCDGNDHRSTYLDAFKFPLDIHLFKREIPDGMDERVKPISFAVPKNLVVKKVPKKIRLLAPVIPADFGTENRKTHVFMDQESYYKSYQESWFGINVEKGGVCCQRIFDVLSNACITIFGDLENCPTRTHVNLPKKELLAVKDIPGLILKQRVFNKHQIDSDSVTFTDEINYGELERQAEFFLDYTRNNLTTEALAVYILSEIGV